MSIEKLIEQSEKYFKTENASQLDIRKESLRKHIRDMKPTAMESPEETVMRKKPYTNLFNKFTQVIDQKRHEEDQKTLDRERAYTLNEIPKHINPLRVWRYLEGSELDMIKKGLSKPDQHHWKPVLALKFEIETQDGRKVLIDMTTINPRLIRIMLNDSMAIQYLPLKDVIALRDGKPTNGFWDHLKDFGNAKNDKPVYHQTWIAFRCI